MASDDPDSGAQSRFSFAVERKLADLRLGRAI